MQRMTFRQSDHRAGYTVLELLVVVAIISILASIGFVMVRNFGGTSREAQTQATLKKVDAALQDRLQAMSRFFEIADRRTGRAPNILDSVSHPAYVDLPSDRQNWDQAKGNGDSLRMKQIELLARKKFERKNFPMLFGEADTNGDGISDITKLALGTPPPGHDPKPEDDTETAEALYYFLSHAASFGTEAVGSVDFIDREIADTDNDGLQEIVDGWGRPIRYYRWPTRLIRPQTSTPFSDPIDVTDDSTIVPDLAARFLIGNVPAFQVLRNDPQDPLLEINLPPYDNSMSSIELFEQNFHTKLTWHSPLVLSAGEDGIFGLLSPAKDAANFGHLAQPDIDPINDPTFQILQESIQDNISNLLLRVGGK
jgi:prepilin-type N-terminal cleavage/methylation domain-containing protein